MRGRDRGFRGASATWLFAIVLTGVLAGCGTFSSALKVDDAMTASRLAPPVAPGVRLDVPEPSTTPVSPAEPMDFSPIVAAVPEPVPSEATDVEPTPSAATVYEPVVLAALEETLGLTLLDGGSAFAQRAQDPDAMDEEYDPWEPFNEKMFSFNRGLDRWLLKPAARAYNVVMPEPWQVMISNGFDNINFVPRMVNSLLQGKWGGAGREFGRFLINSTAGIGGLFDPAKDFWGIQKSREDFGQTLGVWGSGPGPYVIVPFLEPLTVRDGIGKFVDGLMDPLSYLLPFLWTRAGMKAGDILNERALNLDLFQGFEESVIDMYSAVRHGYLQRRQQLIKE